MNPALNEELKATDARHVARLGEIIRKYGWPGKSMVGEKAAGAAWIIANTAGKSSCTRR